MGLGKLADFSFEEARERARKARQQLAEGIDPLEARKADRAAKALEAAKAMTFEEAAKQYYASHEASWSNAKHRQQFRNTMRDYVLPKIGALAVADVDIGQVLRCIEPHWQTKTATMSRVRARIEAVLAWATVRGYRQGDNPARWRDNLREALPAPNKVARSSTTRRWPTPNFPSS